MSKNHKDEGTALDKYIDRVGATLLALTMPKKQGGITRKEAAALAYGAAMGLGIGYKAGTGNDDPREYEREPQRFGVMLLSGLLEKWPKERERYLSMIENAKSVEVYGWESKHD